MTTARSKLKQAFLIFVAVQGAALAEPTLDDRYIHEIEVETSSDDKLRVTVLRDSDREDQWYYLPVGPRLYERHRGEEIVPEFALLRYQFPDPQNAQKLQEGGVLQFAAVLDLPDGVLAQVREALSTKTGQDPDGLRISAISPKTAEVAIYGPGDNLLVGNGGLGPSIAPTFATQKMAFTLPLSKAGADVYDALVNGQTGVQLGVVLTYSAIRPPAKLTVKVNYQQAHSHYSKSESFRARASYYGLFSASYARDVQKVREELVKEGILEVKVRSGENVKMEDLDRVMIPILDRINKQILETFSPPPRIEPAQAASISAGGRFGGASYSVAIKDVKTLTKLEEEINFDFEEIVERKTPVVGFLGIGGYAKETREKLVTVVQPGPWDAAYFVLPVVADDEEVGISSVSMEVALNREGINEQTQVVTWTGKGGWTDNQGNPRTVIAFPIASLRSKYGQQGLNTARFVSRSVITVGNTVTEVRRDQPVFNGQIAAVTPLSYVDIFAVDPGVLSWKSIEPTSNLLGVNVELRTGTATFRKSLRPRVRNGKMEAPTPAYWVVESSNTPVIANISFDLSGDRRIPWSKNGSNLRDASGSHLAVILENPK